ncbi:MAG: 3'(2'),5'-bisphosphate nucleotidase CysQ [Gammaproteobacteria bacterium]|nr:3'(2'),5'-bisphosphate nucleotidase CysQ [Gammaproteobacteria bacterium]
MNKNDDLNLEYLCQNALSIAVVAGKKILEFYESKYTVENKQDNTPLTTADLAADKIIRNGLKELTPEIPVITEESELPAFEIRKKWHRYWLVDPLDGTREFIKHNGEFTVNISLIENHKSIIGVINVPVIHTDYFAWRDGGAYKRSTNKPAYKINCRKADINKLVIAGSRSHVSDKLKNYLKNFKNIELLSIGSSLKSCLVAEGSVDLYPRLGLTSEWDTAAAHCIVEEAGGYITQTDNTELLYNTKDCLLNPEFFVFGDRTIDWHHYL